MQAFGMLLLAAATAGDGFGYSSPGVRLKKWLRPHADVTRPTTGAPPYTATSLAGAVAALEAAAGSPVTQEPDLLPRPRRHADRLADRRAQRRTDLPARPA